jgi:hypothetical protein
MNPLWIIAPAGLLAFHAFNRMYNFADRLRFYIPDPGRPKISNWGFEHVVNLQFDNHSNTDLRLDALLITIYLYDPAKKAWDYIASSRPAANNSTIAKFTTTTIPTTIRIPLLDFAQYGMRMITNIGKNQLRIEAKPRVEGNHVPAIIKEYVV